MLKLTIPATIAVLLAGAGVAFHLLGQAPPADAAMALGPMDHGHRQLAAEPAAAPANVVAIRDFSFGPTALTVAIGTKVVWTNQDDDPHTVTSDADPKVLESPALDTGDSFAFTFTKPGTYRYFCALHPHMQGIIVVQ